MTGNEVTEKKKKSLEVNAASFVAAIGILAGLMVLTYILTLVVPSGSFDRVISDGKESIVPGSYHLTQDGIPFWKWILSPVMVLGSSQGGTMIAVIAFLLVIGGTFNSLDRSGTMDYMLRKIVHAAAGKKYKLLAVVTLFFLSMGAFIGSFEEAIPMVPLAVSLAIALGWDPLVGLGMSLAAVACGFSTGVFNPFTTGVAQPLMDLPLFSGVSLRLLTFLMIYGSLLLFLISYAKRLEKKSGNKIQGIQSDDLMLNFKKEIKKENAMKFFVGTIGICIASVLICAFIPGLSGILMVLVAVFFLIAGVGSTILSGLTRGQILKSFGQGVTSMFPSVLLILMAGSVQYTMNEAGIMDTILHYAVEWISSMSPYAGILCIFLFTMLINFFVSSGSAEAMLLMPLLGPLSDLCGISRQLTVLAFNYGDGFSNLIYFTNPCLLIALSLAGIGYGKWLKWSLKLQIMIGVCCCSILLLGTMIGY